jgi:hypothetical protein
LILYPFQIISFFNWYSDQHLPHALVLQSKGQNPGDDLPDPSQFIRNGSSSGYNFTGKPDDNHNMVTSAAASGAQELVETDHAASVSYRSAETPTNITSMIANPQLI